MKKEEPFSAVVPQELSMSSEDLSVRRKRVLRSKWPPSFQLVHLSYGGEGGIPRRLAMLVCFSVVAIAPPQMSVGRPPDARLIAYYENQ